MSFFTPRFNPMFDPGFQPPNMTYTEFKTLDKFMQVDMALEEGTIIGKRIENDDLLVLYHLHNFYIELWYLHDLSEIYSIRHTEGDALLEPYLEAIDISELLC